MMQILYNAKIYPLDFQQPSGILSTFSAIAIRKGRILALGDELLSIQETIASAYPELDFPLELIDLGGCVIIPGLTDAHIHLEHYALGLQKVDCETRTLDECLRRIADRADITPPGEWILGHGWNQNNWAGFPTAADLERISQKHPIYLTAKSLHASWANTQALNLAGITSETPDPEGGQIAHYPDGSPSGILLEAAMRLVGDIVPRPDEEQVADAILHAMPGLWQLGITGVHDFDRTRCFAALQRLRARGQLKLRVVKSIPLEELPHAAELGLRSGLGDDWLRIGSVKIFMDGALGPRTAAMLQPYEPLPGEVSSDDRGMLMLDAEELLEHARLAEKNGISVAVHAIGDRANHEVLNAIAQLEDRRLRHRIEHVQLIHDEDAPRLAKLDVIASMQPIHATSDMEMADLHWGGRAALSYAWKTQLDAGAVLVFGSDAPVESPNPWWGIHAAVTRRRHDGSPGPDGWRPEQRLTVIDAILGFTLGPAYAAGMEDRLGKLAPGYLADLLVLDTDPFLCEPDVLKDIRPRATMIGGEWVWDDIGF